MKVSTGPAASGNDGARCVDAPIPTIKVTKTVDSRAVPADQFTVALKDSSQTVLTSAATTGTAGSASTPAWPVSQGATYTITDAMAAGSTSTIEAYDTAISCTDTTTGDDVPVTGSGPSWTVKVATPDELTCEVTNAAARPHYSITKTASPSGSANPGDTITYSVVVTNTGKVPYPAGNPASFTDDLTSVLDDATYNNDATGGATYAAPTLSWSGALAVGASVTVTYSVTLNTPDTGDHTLDNAVVTPPGSGGTCPAGSPLRGCSSSIPIQSYSVTKSVTPAVAHPGGKLTYKVTVTNTGQAPYTAADPASFTDDLSAILDDATYNDDATNGATYDAPVLAWSGPLGRRGHGDRQLLGHRSRPGHRGPGPGEPGCHSGRLRRHLSWRLGRSELLHQHRGGELQRRQGDDRDRGEPW